MALHLKLLKVQSRNMHVSRKQDIIVLASNEITDTASTILVREIIVIFTEIFTKSD
jgi:hypothetical protein